MVVKYLGVLKMMKGVVKITTPSKPVKRLHRNLVLLKKLSNFTKNCKIGLFLKQGKSILINYIRSKIMYYVGKVKIRWYDLSFNIQSNDWLFLMLLRIKGFHHQTPVQTKIIDEKNLEISLINKEWMDIFRVCERYGKPLIENAFYGRILNRTNSLSFILKLKPTKFLPMKLGVKNITLFNAYFYENNNLFLKLLDF